MIRVESSELERLAGKYDESNVPLYLSYPTTGFWRGAWDENAFAAAFDRGTIPFLYFHLPYCKKACWYCCCYKEVTRSDAVKDAYVGSIGRELGLRLDSLGEDRLTGVRHMHWGGGTPTWLSTDQISRMLSAIGSRVELDRGPESTVSIEAYPDPETVTAEKLRVLRAAGFNEISFGVQDFDERIQKAINRDCTEPTLRGLVTLSRNLGFRINIDLCYGLPYQGLAELDATIRTVAEMQPDKIAVFPYAHYPLAFPLQRRIPAGSVPGSFDRVRLIMLAEELFESYGFARIGIDHFVRPGTPLFAAYGEGKVIKDFMGYSVDGRRSYIGLGSSAISFVGDTFFQNTRMVTDYRTQVKLGVLPSTDGAMHRLSTDDVLRYEIIMKHILCGFRIDKREISARFEIDFDEYFRPELERIAELERDGLVERSDADTILVTPVGRYVARHVAYVFDRYYNGN
jgi:oxygen-independent coproporphyrinogen-3 oxidase